MIEIVKKTLEFYIKNQIEPDIRDIEFENVDLMKERKALFVTLYKNGQIHGSAGSVKEKDNVVKELIRHSITALKDGRFENLKQADLDNIKVRIDTIDEKTQLSGSQKVSSINPVNSGVISLKGDYSDIGVILPNISSTIASGKDLESVLKEKMGSFNEKNTINYEIKTTQVTDF